MSTVWWMCVNSLIHLIMSPVRMACPVKVQYPINKIMHMYTDSSALKDLWHFFGVLIILELVMLFCVWVLGSDLLNHNISTGVGLSHMISVSLMGTWTCRRLLCTNQGVAPLERNGNLTQSLLSTKSDQTKLMNNKWTKAILESVITTVNQPG